MDEYFMKIQNRRQMITGTFRYAALSVIGFFAGSAVIKRHRLVKEGKCISRGICGGCELYEGCQLPSALSKKQFFYRKKQ
ncbi:MAG: hypothetical protein H8D47_01005 [Planctomycetes bacterium]|nr:hypothetical protein [Planctomycetota bacterium]MBL7106032.1 hypothetical protein [Phycisphaerae bacterium]